MGKPSTSKDTLRQLAEQVKSQHRYWEILTPEERKAFIVQMRDAQSSNAQKSIIFVAIVGIVFSAFTVYFWLNEYLMSFMSSLGIVGGVIFAIFGLQYIRVNKIKSHQRIWTDYFSEDDVRKYFEEHERINERALEQLSRYRYLAFVIGGLFILSLNFDPTRVFSLMALFSGTSIFLLGLVVYFVVQKIGSW